MEQTKTVRVSYVPKGFGLALEIDDTAELAIDRDGARDDDAADCDDADRSRVDDGVLTISDASITLELPTADGKISRLAWDPAEVSWDSLIAS